MHPIVLKFLEIVKSADSELNSFYIRDHIQELQTTFPFLHDRMGVSTALERIAAESNNPEFCLELSAKHPDIYGQRNLILLAADAYIKQNQEEALKQLVTQKLPKEFAYLGYRKLMIYYAQNYDEKKFGAVYKKINRRKTLNPYENQAIQLFIEKYAAIHGLDGAQKMAQKLKLEPTSQFVLLPIFLGLGSPESIAEIRNKISKELSPAEGQAFLMEEVFTKFYERAESKEQKMEILGYLEAYAHEIPQDLRIKGYPGKFWSLYLWRLGTKYLALEEPEPVLQIIKKLRGKNKEHLKKAYEEKYGPA